MNVWLVTTGSSDVQLTSDEDWNDWWQEIKKALYRVRFDPTRAIDDDDEPYRLPARVLGIAHDRLPNRVQPHLSFPLLQNFTQALKIKDIQIDQIIVLLSDQENIFPESERETKRCPYWQDTCQLYPILESYFHIDFPDAVVKPLTLKPESIEKGLDDWDAVLELVQKAIESLEFDTKLQTVYVSHQAGTPAISSAVQFASLAKFGDRIKFLVSNEQSTRTSKILESSSYLKGIRKEEAKALLQRYDYSGMRDLLRLTETTETTAHEKLVKSLLDAGEQWNFAEFHKFKNKIIRIGLIENNNFPWWRLGYESAYLALIRLQQGDTVEALFHSFRAMEGMINTWAEKHFANHIIKKGDQGYRRQMGSQIKKSISSELPGYINSLSEPNRNKLNQYGGIGLYGDPLYELFRQARTEWIDDPHVEVVWKTAKGERNTLFHSIEGLQPKDVFEAWDVNVCDDWEKDIREWEARLCGCLNFIAKEKFESLKEASLMAKVHEKLESAIAQL